MTRARLIDVEASIDVTCRDILGHIIFYTPAGQARRTITVQGDYNDGMIAAATSAGIEQEIELMALKTDVPTRPGSGDRITLPAVANAIWQPVNVQNDHHAKHWIFNLKKVAA